MHQLVFCPHWFYGIDALFEILTIIVAVLLAIISYKCFHFYREYKFKYFSLSFLSIALAYAIKILTSINLYYHLFDEMCGNLLTPLHILGYFLFRFLFLLGLLGIWASMVMSIDRKTLLLIAYLLFVVSLWSNNIFLIFHLTAFVILAIIFHYSIKNYLRHRTSCAEMVAVAFFLILLSQVIFIFLLCSLNLYVIGEIIQTLGYSVLLITYLIIKKK
jgi:hypothetical protein